MSQYGANKVATAVLLDTSPGMDAVTSDGTTHFERSKWILSRIILRKMFAYESDEVGILTFGVAGVHTVSHLSIANWEMFRAAEDTVIDSESAGVIKTTQNAGNWAKGLIKAVDFLEEESQGKRFKGKQLVVLSNFTWSSPNITNRLETLVTVINGQMLKVIVIGVDIKKESQDLCDTPIGLGELLEFVGRLDGGVTLSFEEAEEDMKFYDKKKKAKRLTKGVMKIGSQINVPFKWMKVTNEDTRLKFSLPPLRQESNSLFSKSTVAGPPGRVEISNENGGAPKQLRNPDNEIEESPCKKSKPDEVFPDARVAEDRKFSVQDVSRVELQFAQDESRKTLFGATEVLLTYADLESMKRQTGPPSFTFLGSVKSSKITRSMLVGGDVYVMVSDGTKRSEAQLAALINALLSQNKYGLARRIAVKNGKVVIGILFPVSDDLGKALYFIKLPVADWVKSVPLRAIPDTTEQPLVDLMNNLIDKMSIQGVGRDLLLRDPNFQTRCALVESKARSLPESGVPDYISALYDPYPELLEAGVPIISKILEAYPIPPPPPNKGEKVVNTKDAKKGIEVKKELTAAEKEEVAEIQKLVSCDPDSLLIDGQKLYDERVVKEEMDTEDVFKPLQSPP
ncbi:hypothetical protein GE061_006785 [Apolygus lucorum]|uniref:Uncharacterized protein n=1 Tax=Apolygus lucorum TaxID=248454 RepID=A0A6A4J4N2_APOLU|nr:hypothetical protein GE061_006785 [Apolygus lucorum]